tara:strand:+ start:101 stop:565 length:465 start_codon:yes stop_codon:yes gene_type:complete
MVVELRWLLERQLSWIAAADGKLAILGPLPIAMLAVSLSSAQQRFSEISWADFPVLVSTLFLFLSLFYTKAAITPRLSGPVDSDIFFVRISSYTTEEFIERVRSKSNAEFEEDIMRQIHRNASIAKIKHANVAKSVMFLSIATPLWLLSIATGV